MQILICGQYQLRKFHNPMFLNTLARKKNNKNNNKS
jgi:hypothetical protein